MPGCAALTASLGVWEGCLCPEGLCVLLSLSWLPESQAFLAGVGVFFALAFQRFLPVGLLLSGVMWFWSMHSLVLSGLLVFGPLLFSSYSVPSRPFSHACCVSVSSCQVFALLGSVFLVYLRLFPFGLCPLG